jgi:hypothetical protein
MDPSLTTIKSQYKQAAEADLPVLEERFFRNPAIPEAAKSKAAECLKNILLIFGSEFCPYRDDDVVDM